MPAGTCTTLKVKMARMDSERLVANAQACVRAALGRCGAGQKRAASDNQPKVKSNSNKDAHLK